MYRPQKLEDLIGCDHIKQMTKVAMDASIAKNDAFPHLLIYGPPGLGKTLLANMIAKERGVSIKKYQANVIKGRVDVQIMLSQLSSEGCDITDEDGLIKVGKLKPSILFLDEIHELTKDTQECFLQAMEENIFTAITKDKYSKKEKKELLIVPPFTLMGATTKINMLDRAFTERFKLVYSLDLYSKEELVRILKNYVTQDTLFKERITEAAINEIAKRSRGVVRKALNFLERCRDTAIFFGHDEINEQITKKTFELLSVDDSGLESVDHKVLGYLYRIYPQRIGSGRLANAIGVPDIAYKEIIEPYLARQGFIEVTPSGRAISEKGMLYCDKNKVKTTDPTEEVSQVKQVSRRLIHADSSLPSR